MNQQINQRLREARKKSRKTQLDVALDAGITERNYRRIEYGQSTDVYTAKLIARSLGTETDYIFPTDGRSKEAL